VVEPPLENILRWLSQKYVSSQPVKPNMVEKHIKHHLVGGFNHLEKY